MIYLVCFFLLLFNLIFVIYTKLYNPKNIIYDVNNESFINKNGFNIDNIYIDDKPIIQVFGIFND